MPVSSTCVLLRVLSSFQRCNPCIFVMCEVTSANLQSEALGNSVFRDLVISLSPGAVYLMLSYIHVVSERSVPLLRMISKDVLLILQ